MKPKEPIPHNYAISTLNKIFALSSLALLALVGALVLYDYSRGWKQFQVGFMRLQRERIGQELDQVRAKSDRKEIERLNALVARQEASIAANRDAFRTAQKEVENWEGRRYAADQDYRFAKASMDAMRYEAERAAFEKSPGWEETRRAFDEQVELVQRLKVRLEDVEQSLEQARLQVAEFTRAIDEAQDEKKKLLSAVERTELRLKNVETGAQFVLLNSPLLDFINPNLRVQQIVARDLYVDLNYLHVPRVDRCVTCHVAIDKSGFESREEASRLVAMLEQQIENFEIPTDRIGDVRARIERLQVTVKAPRNLANPYRTHPRLEDFVGSASPHPLLDYGCTVCHRGLDRATDFARAGHMTRNEEKRERWVEKWGWEDQPFLETPMYERAYREAGCLKCHSSEIDVPESESISEATHMVELYGCYACHKIDNWRFQNLRRPGPDLTGIAEKTTPEWAYHWIARPSEFRPTTRMPSFFFQRNMIGPAVSENERNANIHRQDAEIQAIVRFLFARSKRRAWSAPHVEGDAGRGEQLVDSAGCLGCHVKEETVTEEDGTVRPARRDDYPLERLYGFNLVGTGTKTNPAWLFNWLKDPRSYYHAAPMPDLRLTDQEAADITAYLMSLRKDDFVSDPVPVVDPVFLRELTRSYMVTLMSERETDRRLDEMSVDEQLVFLGERSVEKYGCYSCHTISGFEDTKPIGTELTTEGSKALHLFDFGLVHEYEASDGEQEHIEHSVSSWVYNKLRSPRVWDDHRAKPYQDKLKMPNFHLSPREAEMISSVVLGLTKERVEATRLASRDARSRRIEEGRKLVSQHNCRACHVVNHKGRAIATTIEDPGMYPPDLTPQGGRVQSDWLFNFLKEPGAQKLRPWLSARMPTFHFSDEEATTLVEHFAGESDVPLFETNARLEPDPRSVEVGGIVFRMLRCAQCHPSGGEIAPTVDLASLAPDLQLSRARLRYDWIPEWIQRPNEIIPGTRMPTNFPRDPDSGSFTSPLPLAIDSPANAALKEELMRLFGSEEELRETLADAGKVTEFLRDYIWSIGSPRMYEAAPTRPPFIAPSPATTAPDQMSPALETRGAPAATANVPGLRAPIE